MDGGNPWDISEADDNTKKFFGEFLQAFFTGLDKKFRRKIVNIFLPINFNICYGYSKEPSH